MNPFFHTNEPSLPYQCEHYTTLGIYLGYTIVTRISENMEGEIHRIVEEDEYKLELILYDNQLTDAK